MKRVVILFVFLLILAWVVIIFLRPTQKDDREDHFKQAIDQGVDFLYKNQFDYGEFKIFLCSDTDMKTNCVFQSTNFATAFIVYALRDIDTNKVKIMKDKAINFLSREGEPGGTWRYVTSRYPKTLPPDLEDVSMISYVLKMNNIQFDDNLQTILQNRNDEGLFFTYFPDLQNKNDKEYDRSTHPIPLGWSKNDIDCYYGFVGCVDCVVNTNALFYLGENDTANCMYINNAIKSNKQCSAYYPGTLALYRAVPRALKNGVTCFEESRDIIIERIVNMQAPDGSFGSDIENALALAALMDFDFYDKEVGIGIEYLLSRQKTDGSWQNGPFFYEKGYAYWGSRELTTAFALEAINTYFKYFQITEVVDSFSL